MKYYVYAYSRYETYGISVFDDKEAAAEYVSQQLSRENKVQVIRGNDIEITPVEVVTKVRLEG